jgi:DNA-binding transcriptional MerR regulator
VGRMVGIRRAAELFGVTTATLRDWEGAGRLAEYGITVYRTPAGYRRFDEEEIVEALRRHAVGAKAGSPDKARVSE